MSQGGARMETRVRKDQEIQRVLHVIQAVRPWQKTWSQVGNLRLLRWRPAVEVHLKNGGVNSDSNTSSPVMNDGTVRTNMTPDPDGGALAESLDSQTVSPSTVANMESRKEIMDTEQEETSTTADTVAMVIENNDV